MTNKIEKIIVIYCNKIIWIWSLLKYYTNLMIFSVLMKHLSYTVDVTFRNKVVYCTLGSSMVRNQLNYQKDVLLGQMNEYLASDELFVKEGEPPYITEIVLR